jgi:hypothetical protein
MTVVHVRGTTDPDDIAVVLALLGSEPATGPARDGLPTWRERRRTALGTTTRKRPQETC